MLIALLVTLRCTKESPISLPLWKPQETRRQKVKSGLQKS